MTRKKTFLSTLRRLLGNEEEGQGAVEVIIIAGAVTLLLVWLVTVLPTAIQTHYRQNQKILASPL